MNEKTLANQVRPNAILSFLRAPGHSEEIELSGTETQVGERVARAIEELVDKTTDHAGSAVMDFYKHLERLASKGKTASGSHLINTLHMISRRRRIDDYRKAASRREVQLPDELDAGSRSDPLESEEFWTCVEETLRAQAPQVRLILRMRLDGTDFRTIAEATELSVDAVYKKYARLLESLTQQCSE